MKISKVFLIIICICSVISFMMLSPVSIAAETNVSITRRNLTETELLQSTETLVDFLINGDYALDLCVMNSYEYAYEILYSKYNIFAELENRQNSGSILLNKYLSLVDEDINANAEEGAELNLHIFLLTIMLSEDVYVAMLSQDELLLYADHFGTSQTLASRAVSLGSYFYGYLNKKYTSVAYDSTLLGDNILLFPRREN